VSVYQKWSKEGTVVNQRQGHGRPRLIDARGERRLACVIRSNRLLLKLLKKLILVLIERSEYNAFWRCVQAGATYLFVQLCKMLFLATFFPTWEGGAGVYDFVGEFMKATVDMADLLGLHLVMSRNAGKGEYKIMVAAMGWATAELVMSRNGMTWKHGIKEPLKMCIPLWVGARGIEFDWKYIQMSFDSNISLVHYIAMAAVVWMFTRYDLPKSFRLPVTVLLGLCVYKAFLMDCSKPDCDGGCEDRFNDGSVEVNQHLYREEKRLQLPQEIHPLLGLLGTTWMQEILPLLLNGEDFTPVLTIPNWDRVPWLEESRAAEIEEKLNAPRAFVSHMPYHLMPSSFFSSKAKVIYISRNPKDVLVSTFHFHQMASFLHDPGAFEEFADQFLAGN
ncbi:hypothetical protein QTP86_034661, partial [Hemibagrus guttatus]